MTSITRRFTFCSGHRLLNHEGHCRHLHGHNYAAEIEVESPDLDKLGRVVDFSVVKAVVGHWIEENWDHAFIFNRADEQVRAALEQCPGKAFEMTVNPTAENMAAALLATADDLLHGRGLRVTRVTLWETENCRAEVRA